MQIGLSPCPNDTFIFYALLHQKIDTYLRFEPVFNDVEKLNLMAFDSTLPISKLSFHAYMMLQDKYVLLDAGAALGAGCGPLLICKNPINNIENASIGIPGQYTTAHLLLKIFYPNCHNKELFRFDEIESAISRELIDAGVIIHENRFTYQEKGLQLICDLGAKWEQATQCLIPLGGIFISKANEELAVELSMLIKKSIEYAYRNEAEVLRYCQKYAQEMNEIIMKKHIDLYVNQYSLSLGNEGNKAIQTLQKYSAVLA
jgi:1,4-dihydroxy-6-naphthoate synthase